MDDVTNPLIGKAKVLRDPGSNDAKLLICELMLGMMTSTITSGSKGKEQADCDSVVNQGLLVGGHYGMDRWVTI